MAVLVDFIDEIARKKKRDVLWIFFDPDHYRSLDESAETKVRKTVDDWLNKHEINYYPCLSMFNESWNAQPTHIYVDLIHDPEDQLFQKLDAFLCKEVDGAQQESIPSVYFYVLPYKVALENEELYVNSLGNL